MLNRSFVEGNRPVGIIMPYRCRNIESIRKFHIDCNICIRIQFRSKFLLIAGVIYDMVVQMLFCLHGIHTKTPFNGQISENFCAVMVIHHIVGNMLNNRRGLFIIDKSRSLDNKFLRIILKLIEHTRLNTLQNLNNCLAGKPCFLYKLANQIVFHIRAGSYGMAIACGFLFHKGISGYQLFLGLNCIHGSGFHLDDFCYSEFTIKGLNSLTDQFLGIKVNHIGRFGIDLRPQCLKFGHSKLIFIHMQLHVVASGIFGHHRFAVINSVDNLNHRGSGICHFLGNLDFMIGLVSIVFIGKNAFLINVAVDDQVKVDCSCRILINNLFIALIVLNYLANKQFCRNCTRAVGHCLCNFRL